ncbi:MAG: 2,4-diaminopentanoate dehydrogenase [Candidatus Izemoplasmataceae bacterium]
MDTIKVIVWGFGAMGKGITEMLLEKRGVEIVGICDLDPNYVGNDFKNFIDTNNKHKSINISDDIDSIIKETNPDIALVATDSFTSKTYEKIAKLVNNKINVISTAEEMAFPYASEPELSLNIDELAKKNGVSVLGTGINPGFVMDLLVIALTGVMRDVKEIDVSRINSLSPFGPTVMEEQGVGISLSEYNNRIKNNSLAGHVGFKESINMIAKALGINITKFEQQMKPIISENSRKSKYTEVEPGNLAGINMTAQGFVDNDLFINMSHPQQIEPESVGIETGDYIKIKGNPEVNMTITPEIDGGVGTIAMCVNMIPHVLNAKPGLKTMIDLPVPRAILGDMRELLE